MRAPKIFMLCLVLLGNSPTHAETIKTITLPPETATFDNGDNVNLVMGSCLLCHSADYPTTQPLPTRSGWQAVVDKMRNTFGAPVPSVFDASIVDYLVTHYGCQPVSVSGFWPGAGDANQMVFVFGQNFNILHGGMPVIRFNSIQSSIMQILTNDFLFAWTPPGNTIGPITVETACGIAASPTDFGKVISTLNISGLWPSTVHVSDIVFVFGSGFNPQFGASTVDIGGTPAPIVQVLDSTLLFFLVPPGATTGPVRVTVGGTTALSPTNLVIVP